MRFLETSRIIIIGVGAGVSFFCLYNIHVLLITHLC